MNKNIQDLELKNENNCKDRDEKIVAMGKDMGTVIHGYNRLKRKYQTENR